ncbi:cryptococcal mannosyltransferase 1-domain-containing protein [Lipomyces kononenkoae]|uniref:Cryptococcal mannosyltransferase 1-domain-containing protein n=1 Tax=Lipomyces kononenkoae TaxID=34357 RepID=A0ACC3STH9_LIPKO
MNFCARFCLLPVVLWLWHPILTHNSLGLCAYLATVFVYVPVAVIYLGWRLVKHWGKRQNDETTWEVDIFKIADVDVKGVENHWRVPRHLSSLALQGLLFGLGSMFVVWTLTVGIASPFSDGKAVLGASPVLQEALTNSQKYYIAANLRNNEAILDHWGRELIQAIKILGSENVYVSIVENDSEDRTPDKLRELSLQFISLSIAHTIETLTGVRPGTHAGPWNNISERVTYLTKIRNMALEPLSNINTGFSRIIYLNDVLFHHSDMLRLIADSYTPFYTNRLSPGRLPTMVCGLDIQRATLYDRWVLKDKCGRPISGMYPYFESASDQSIVRRSGVLEVGVCWNGMVVMQADPFLNSSLRHTAQDWREEQLRFPELPDYCVVSECTLLPLNLLNSTIGNAPLALMDTSVVLSYTWHWYFYYAQLLRWPVVRLWRSIWEDFWWQIWWQAGFRNLYAWKGVDSGHRLAECKISDWPSCPGSIRRGQYTFSVD